MNYRDEFKISFVKKPDYFVDAKKKTVKCYLTCDVKVPNALNSNQIMNNTRISATGYAKCDNKDVFNEFTGKKIALARAEEKIYFKALHMIKLAKKDAEVFLNAFDKFEDKCYRVCAHNEDYVDQFCFASHPCYHRSVSAATSEKLSRKAKAQPRDEFGRFTACTDTNKSCNKSKNVYNKDINNLPDSNGTIIKIKINRI